MTHSILSAIGPIGGVTVLLGTALPLNSAPTTSGDPQQLAQVTSVSQLSDVQPTDWAFQALQSLVERYGCIAGYPDGTFRGNNFMTRYEFAAGLNACLDQIIALIDGGDAVDSGDLLTIRRLQEEFAAELSTLRGRTDRLEARTSELEANQFSTTSILQGEVAFVLADAWGGDGISSNSNDAQTIFASRGRLNLVTSFTGRDRLHTRLQFGNLGNGFADQINTNEGRFAFDGDTDNSLDLNRLHYVFPATDNLQVTIMANAGGHQFYSDTFNPGLEAGGGAGGALSRFGERNPIYRSGLGGVGLGLRQRLGDNLELSLGYVARGGNNPSEGAGLFNGNYSALGQLVVEPSDRFKFGLTYIHAYDVSQGRRFGFGGTGTQLSNLSPAALAASSSLSQDQLTTPVSSNHYGLEMLWDLSPQFRIGAWGGFTNARLIGLGDAEIWNYALTLSFPDLLLPGNFGALIVGSEPYLGGIDVPGTQNFQNETPLHIEGLYRLQVSENISITPGFIWLVNPNQNADNDGVFIGTLRTTFSF
ncbi:iron uptake porin [Phormidium yuhuli AB48]|uniref:Iron uptake porin n=1 Tax=Phormidium yuhuli AB48 TaxID=2940671 RepID=A0ABY5AP63_9CYAN|nr:iron uptake porin [Phormidium yuhuli]USR91004.1 iron uptake porin [Phormidium yuhuli AB48]